ncbi:MAG TPA: c-type cytochrome [Gammaproteobacteria bacterium]|jgi:mono/diheme cytochrome c family protein
MASRLTLSLIALLLLGGAIYMLTALAATAQTFDLADLTGAELFERFCAACHGSEAHGDGPVARGLATTVPDLTLISERNGGRFPADAIRETIDGRSPVLAHGTRVMPIWGYEFWVEEGADITAEREARELMRRLVLYLESIQTD